MASPALVSLADFEARLPGVLADSDQARAQAAIDDASAFVRAEAGEDWLDDAGALEAVPAAVVAIVCRVAYRAFTNADGTQQQSIAGYSESFANASPDVYLTAQERRTLRRVLGRGGLGSVELESPWLSADAVVYLSDLAGGDSIPWPAPPTA